MSVSQSIKPEIVVGAFVVVDNIERVQGSFFKIEPELLGKKGTVVDVDRSYTVYQPEAIVRFEDGTENTVELPNLEVTERPVVKATETVARQPRVKYLYTVEDNGVTVYTTFDREDAREEKAFLGGKAEGVIITAYAPVKEIR